MNLSNSNYKKIATPFLVLIFLTGSVWGYQYFIVSDTLTDEVSVTANKDRNKVQLSYVPGQNLGGKNRELKVGKWEEFQVCLKNKSSRNSDAWKNVFVRSKFYDVEPENLHLEYRHEDIWNEASIFDSRSLNLSQLGGVSDLGPSEGYTIEPQTEKAINLRVKVDRVIENMKVEFQAVTNSQVLENFARRIKDPEEREILNPVMDTYVKQNAPPADYSKEDYLELTTQENNGNSYALVMFDYSNIPNEISSAKLNLYQYWGYGFTDLRDSGVNIQLFQIPVDLSEEENITLKAVTEKLGEPLGEENIIGTKKWYSFDLTKHLKNKGQDRETFLLKFSKDSFDNEKRRIRFDSMQGKNPPVISLIPEN